MDGESYQRGRYCNNDGDTTWLFQSALDDTCTRRGTCRIVEPRVYATRPSDTNACLPHTKRLTLSYIIDKHPIALTYLRATCISYLLGVITC